MEQIIFFWQHLPQHINPVLLSVGPLNIYYYSLMYVIAFGLTYFLVSYRIKTENFGYSMETIQNCMIWCIVGLLVGARLGYVLFYNLSYYTHHPLAIVLPMEFSNGITFVGIRGMSYHGGVAGIIVAAVLFCRRYHTRFWKLADIFCPAIPLGYTFGRIGNFINGELYGRATDVSWGMYFPLDPDFLLRHPSQIYEAFFEGVVLFSLLWVIRKKVHREGYLFGLYFVGYGMVRFFIEFFREPDRHLGFITGFMTMGQLLCLAMIICGLGVLIIKKEKHSNS